MNALQFSVNNNADSHQFGRFYWMVGLADGREFSLCADRMDSTAGVLSFYLTNTETVDEDGVRVMPEEQILALPPGVWVHAYNASGVDGTPLMIENLPEPRTRPSPWMRPERLVDQ